jgi:hypothetical protein
VEKVIFVLKMDLDRCRRVFDLLRHLPHGDALIALGKEQLAGRVQNDFPCFALFSFSTLSNAHNDSQ